jgi:CheY-like chemotaxis protein
MTVVISRWKIRKKDGIILNLDGSMRACGHFLNLIISIMIILIDSTGIKKIGKIIYAYRIYFSHFYKNVSWMPTADVVLVMNGRYTEGQVLLQSLEKLNYRVLKQVDRVEDVIQVISQLPEDLILIDMYLQNQVESLRITDQLRRQHGIPVIFVSSFADAAFLQRSRTS